MAALSAAAIAGYTNSLLAFGVFLAPALAPYAARLILLDGGFDPMVAAFCAFWAVLMGIMARHLDDGFREGLGLSIRNARLAEGIGWSATAPPPPAGRRAGFSAI